MSILSRNRTPIWAKELLHPLTSPATNHNASDLCLTMGQTESGKLHLQLALDRSPPTKCAFCLLYTFSNWHFIAESIVRGKSCGLKPADQATMQLIALILWCERKNDKYHHYKRLCDNVTIRCRRMAHQTNFFSIDCVSVCSQMKVDRLLILHKDYQHNYRDRVKNLNPKS